MTEKSDVKYLETAELLAAAEREAQHFELPPNWREGRQTRDAIAIDEPASLDRDDAISLTVNPDGTYILHVSIADVGTFLADKPAIVALAQRSGWARYRGSRLLAPMIPNSICRDSLSLLQGKERPALTIHVPINQQGELGAPQITREIVVAQAFSYEQVNQQLQAGTAHPTLRHLEYLARLRSATRTGNSQLSLFDSDDDSLPPPDASSSWHIVHECMVAAGQAFATYAQQHNIDVLYRTFNPEDGGARYGLSPEPHDGLLVPAYVHGTAPLRRFADFALHCNIVAHMEGRPPVVSTHKLAYTANRLNRLEQNRRAATSESKEHIVNRALCKKMGRATLDLMQKIDDGTITESDLAHLFFGHIRGTEEQNSLARQQAAEYIARNLHMARNVINIAAARKHITIAPTDNGSHLTLRTAAGQEYVYATHRTVESTTVETAKLLGRIAGVDIESSIPPYRVLRVSYLKHLSKKRNFTFRVSTKKVQEEDVQYQATAVVVIDGIWQMRCATATGRKQAEQQAAAILFADLDLINNPPDGVRYPLETNPLQQLHTHLQKTHQPLPEYTHVQVSPLPRPCNRCIATGAYKGMPYQIITEAPSYEQAKKQAAGLLAIRLKISKA